MWRFWVDTDLGDGGIQPVTIRDLSGGSFSCTEALGTYNIALVQQT